MKIFAYLLSLACAVTSLFFILMYGISFGNEKVQKWVTSLLVSILSSVFVTQPLQVALTAVFLVSVFRKATEFYKEQVNDTTQIKKTDDDLLEDCQLGPMPKTIGNTVSVDYIRKERLRERKFKEIAKKVLLHSTFLWILYVTAYSNRDLNSYRYAHSLKSLLTNTEPENSADSVQNVNNKHLLLSKLKSQIRLCEI
jgi:hypothetical protein